MDEFPGEIVHGQSAIADIFSLSSCSSIVGSRSTFFTVGILFSEAEISLPYGKFMKEDDELPSGSGINYYRLSLTFGNVKVFSKYSKEDYATMGLFFLAFAGFALSQQICVFLYVPTRPVSIGFRLILLCFCFFFIFRQIFGDRTIYKGLLLPIFLIWAVTYIIRVKLYSTENVQTLHPSGVYLQMLIGMCLLPCLGFMYSWDERRLQIGLYSVS